MAGKAKITVIGELADGDLTAHARELLGGARKLADVLNWTVEIVLLGKNVDPVAAGRAVSQGADVVRIFRNPLLENYNADVWLGVLHSFFSVDEPAAVLLAQTATGRDLGPRLAHRMDAAIAMDCVQIDADPDGGVLRMTRPVFGGKAMAVVVCRTSPQMATVRARSMKALDPDPARQGKVMETEVEIEPAAIRVRLVGQIREQSDGVPLEESAVVVSGGRGMGGREGFAMLEELACLFNGAVGSSRPPCDSGWVPSSKQVGLTGKIIRPNLYFAVALSGTSQHMAGCQDSGTIIAINKDPEANIFSYAHFGVVDDYRKVLPCLIARLKEKLG